MTWTGAALALGVVWTLVGLALLWACFRDGGGARFHIGHYLLVIFLGPPVILLLLVEGVWRGHKPDLP